MTSQSENKPYKWAILLVASLLQAAIAMASFSFGPLAPFLRDSLNITRAEVGLFASILFVTAIFLSLPAGWVINRFGLKKLILIGPGFFAIMYALLCLIPDIRTGYFLMTLAGIGYLFVTPTTTLALVRWFPGKSKATAVSIKQSFLTLGTATGAIVVPSLAVLSDWRATIAIIGTIAFATAVLASIVYREVPAHQSPAKLPAFATFKEALRNKNLLMLGLFGAFFIAFQLSILDYTVLQLVEVRQLTAVVAGGFLATTNIAGAAGRIFWGALSDRFFRGQRRMVLVMVGIIAGVMGVVMSVASATMPYWLLYITMAVLGATAIGWNGVQLTFATEISNTGGAAMGLGLVLTLQSVGALLGPPIFGHIVDVTSSYGPAWLVFGITTMVASLSVILIKERQTVSAQQETNK